MPNLSNEIVNAIFCVIDIGCRYSWSIILDLDGRSAPTRTKKVGFLAYQL